MHPIIKCFILKAKSTLESSNERAVYLPLKEDRIAKFETGYYYQNGFNSSKLSNCLSNKGIPEIIKRY